jgi:hypothetical protein
MRPRSVVQGVVSRRRKGKVRHDARVDVHEIEAGLLVLQHASVVSVLAILPMECGGPNGQRGPTPHLTT